MALEITLPEKKENKKEGESSLATKFDAGGLLPLTLN